MRMRLLGIPLLGMLLLIQSCNKFERNGQMDEPGVAITFDDDYIDNWYQYLPLLDSAGVRATFYVCRYNRFTPEQKRKLAVIQSHGHEIAYHGTNHYNMMEYVYKHRHSMEEYIRREVEAGLKMMNCDGFFPTTFAYPMGAHNGVFDKALKRYFKSVRALNGTTDYTRSLAPTKKNDLLFGLGIDKSSKRTDDAILKIIKSAWENRNCAVFVAHNIERNISLSVTKDRLIKMFAYINSLGLKYYTVSEISN